MIHAVPNIKAAEKWALQSEKRAARNKNVKSRLKTLFKRAAESGDAARQQAPSRAPSTRPLRRASFTRTKRRARKLAWPKRCSAALRCPQKPRKPQNAVPPAKNNYKSFLGIDVDCEASGAIGARWLQYPLPNDLTQRARLATAQRDAISPFVVHPRDWIRGRTKHFGDIRITQKPA